VTDDDLNVLHMRYHQFLLNLRNEPVTLYVHVVRELQTEIPERGGAAGFSRELAESYRSTLGGKLFKNEIYFSVVYQPQSMKVQRVFAKTETREEKIRTIEDALEKFGEIAKTIEQGLSAYVPQALGTYEHNGQPFSKILEFYHFLLNGYHQRFPLVRRNLQDVLLTARPLWGSETGELRGPTSSCFVAALGVKQYPSMPFPGIFAELLEVPFEFVLTQSFAVMEQRNAVSLLTRIVTHKKQTEDHATSEIADIEGGGEGSALDDLAAGRIVMGEHHIVFLTKAKTSKSLQDNVSQGVQILSDAGCVVGREDAAIEAAYLSQIPGNLKYRPRPAPITSENFAMFTALYNEQSGHASGNHWGDSIAVLRTAQLGPFHFNFHVKDRGHTFVCGPTGSGKTAFVGFLSAMMEQYRARGVYFDYLRGAEIYLRALGGQYYALRDGRPTGFNPFHLPPDQENILFVQSLVRMLATSVDRELTVKQIGEIDKAVTQVFGLSFEHRRLRTVLQYLIRTEPNGVAKRLGRWVEDGPLAWLFDNEKDTLDFGRLTGFDMTDFLDNQETRDPLMMYLFRRMKMLRDGNPMYVVFEEFWKTLMNEDFAQEVKQALYTTRKADWMLVFVTLSAHDVAKSSISHEIVEQTVTQIFFPNPSASEEDYRQGFKLNEREFELVRHMSARQILIRQEGRSVVVNFDLAGLQELSVLSGTTRNIELLDAIRKRVGDDPERWLPKFYSERR
jgi:type IV secretion system protein VirB4